MNNRRNHYFDCSVLHLATLHNSNVTDWLAFLLYTCVLDLVDNVHAVNDFAEHHMFVVQKRRWYL